MTLVPQSDENTTQYVPFGDVSDAFTHPRNLAPLAAVFGNVLLFAPLGALLRLQGLRARRVILVGFALSVPIELAQLAVPGRTTSVDDVLLNTEGNALGAVVALRLPARQ